MSRRRSGPAGGVSAPKCSGDAGLAATFARPVDGWVLLRLRHPTGDAPGTDHLAALAWGLTLVRWAEDNARRVRALDALRVAARAPEQGGTAEGSPATPAGATLALVGQRITDRLRALELWQTDGECAHCEGTVITPDAGTCAECYGTGVGP